MQQGEEEGGAKPEDFGGVVGLAGTGSVGSGWAAAYLGAGYEVLAYDPAPDAPDRLKDFLRDSWPALRDLGKAADREPPLDRLRFAPLAEVASTASLIHENAPEDLSVKRDLLAKIEAVADRATIICSSSGGLPPSDLQSGMIHPERLVVAHPFNPPHLVPLIEVIAGRETAPEIVDQVMALMHRLGKRPIRLDREMTAYMANRLQFALLREAVHCLAEGVASAGAIEDAIRYALGPRWVAVGGLMTFALAGGPGGMANTLAKFGGVTEMWWASLGTPRLTEEVCRKLVAGADELAAGRSSAEWIAHRDAALVKMFQLLAEVDAARPGAA